MTSRSHAFSRRLQSGFLLLALIGVLAATFLADGGSPIGRWFSGAVYVVVFSLAGYLLGARRRWLTAYGLIAVPAVLSGVIASSVAPGHRSLDLTRDLLALGMQGLLVWLVFRFSLFERRASRLDRIIAGICGYLILGMIWANLYSLLETLQPGGLVAGGGAAVRGQGGGFLYFSLITLSTTGFGDVVPKTPVARFLVSLEAITGTLYLAVFISALVGGASREK